MSGGSIENAPCGKEIADTHTFILMISEEGSIKEQLNTQWKSPQVTQRESNSRSHPFISGHGRHQLFADPKLALSLNMSTFIK